MRGEALPLSWTAICHYSVPLFTVAED